MHLYIYNVHTNEIVQTIYGINNSDCESQAYDANWEQDLYGWTYTNFGLVA